MSNQALALYCKILNLLMEDLGDAVLVSNPRTGNRKYIRLDMGDQDEIYEEIEALADPEEFIE